MATRIKVTYRLTPDLYARLKAFEAASGGVPQQRLVEQILDKALPALKKARKR